jgi:hypothetical protein
MGRRYQFHLIGVAGGIRSFLRDDIMKFSPSMLVARLFILSLFVFLVCSRPVFSADPIEVKAAQVKEMMDGGAAFVVFPLSTIEYNNLHIEGSVNIPIEELPAGLPEDRKQCLIFYCLGQT